MDTDVAIIGAGPAGLTLALMLQRRGIQAVMLEARSREYVQTRVRAGLLEQNTVDLLHDLGVDGRLARDGLPHGGIYLNRSGRSDHIDIEALTGRQTTIYGQQKLVEDLIEAWLARGGELLFEVDDVTLHEIDGDTPSVRFTAEHLAEELDCDLVIGCDGFHGVSRRSIPRGVLTEYSTVYPVSWLGVLAEAPPATDELTYAWHANGFALYSMRSPQISRLYLQVDADEDIADWCDERIWSELQQRLSSERCCVNEGAILERSLTQMRSFVVEPMQYGRLYLAGDAAHIVPPTGAKGLNLAVNDARLLAQAIGRHYESGCDAALDAYSINALRRVWRAQDFSNDMLTLFHRLDGCPFNRRRQLARLDYLVRSEAAARSFAENYVGLPTTSTF